MGFIQPLNLNRLNVIIRILGTTEEIRSKDALTEEVSKRVREELGKRALDGDLNWLRKLRFIKSQEYLLTKGGQDYFKALTEGQERKQRLILLESSLRGGLVTITSCLLYLLRLYGQVNRYKYLATAQEWLKAIGDSRRFGERDVNVFLDAFCRRALALVSREGDEFIAEDVSLADNVWSKLFEDTLKQCYEQILKEKVSPVTFVEIADLKKKLKLALGIPFHEIVQRLESMQMKGRVSLGHDVSGKYRYVTLYY